MDLEALPASADQADHAGQVRVWATGALMKVIRALEPYVTGTFGEVLPQHAQAYVAAVKEINRIWRVSYPIVGQEEFTDPVIEAARMRERVLDQLAVLGSRDPSDPR